MRDPSLRSNRAHESASRSRPVPGQRDVLVSIGCLALLLSPAAAAGQGSPEPAPPRDRTVETAQWLTVAGTLAPVGLMFGGATVGGEGGADLAVTGLLLLIPGPSLGYYYGGRPRRGLASTGLRAASLFGMSYAFGMCWDGCSGRTEVFSGIIALAGIGVLLGSAVHDLTHVGEDLRRGGTGGGVARLAPVVDPIEQRAGLAVSFRF